MPLDSSGGKDPFEPDPDKLEVEQIARLRKVAQAELERLRKEQDDE